MDDNQPPAHADAFALAGASVLAIEGPDAIRFAHAQFMSDVASLADGHWQWSGWLTPKGRLVALFALLRLDARTLWVLLPDFDAGELREALQRYVFRSKLALAVRGDKPVSGAFRKPAGADCAQLGGAGDGLVELDMGTPEAPRTLYLGDRAAITDDRAAARWAVFDLEHGLPRLDASQSGQWTPQQLSLDRLKAYSVKKGCYPGQEIVARTHFLGQAKRGLAGFQAPTSVPPGSEVRDGARAVGSMVSCIATDGGCELLAVLPLDQSTQALMAGDTALQPRPLREGLAR